MYAWLGTSAGLNGWIKWIALFLFIYIDLLLITDVYKIITGVYDRDATTGCLFNFRKDSNARGQQNKIFKERPKLGVRAHSFLFRETDP